jgi:hypothetical protein
MDASLRRTFLPLPARQTVVYFRTSPEAKHGDIRDLEDTAIALVQFSSIVCVTVWTVPGLLWFPLWC